jgi:hypothetical protein
MSATTPLGEGQIGRAQLAGPYGYRVTRAAAVVPQTATGSIYTVRGGRCAIYLVGMFTVAASATATNLTVVNTTSGAAADRGATTNLSSATAIASTAIGSSLTLANTVGGALAIGAGAVIMQTVPHVVNIGTIDLTTSASNATATIKWQLYFVPLEGGAFITAA